jgi:creatinine amidohydrolase
MGEKTIRRDLLKQMAAAGLAATAFSRISEAADDEEYAAPKVRWEEMLPDELLDAISKDGVCYCAYGLAEPHGPYNALGLDWLKAKGIVELAAVMHGGVVAPPFAWHVHDRPFFPWLESQGIKQTLCGAIPGDLWLRTVLHQIRSIDARGFKVGILITGHYGGLQNDLKLLCDYYTRKTGSPLKLFAAADHELIGYEGYGGDHAGLTETSQLLALRPDLVDLSRKKEGWKSGGWAGMQFPTDDGRSPSAEVGEKIVTSQVVQLGHIQKDLLNRHSAKPGWQAPTMTDVDALWYRFEQLTRKYWYLSLTLEELENNNVPEFPGWEALGE